MTRIRALSVTFAAMETALLVNLKTALKKVALAKQHPAISHLENAFSSTILSLATI